MKLWISLLGFISAKVFGVIGQQLPYQQGGFPLYNQQAGYQIPIYNQPGVFPQQPIGIQQGSFPGQPIGSQQGSFPGQPIGIQQGLFPGQPIGSQQGSFPGQPIGIQQGVVPGQPIGIQQGSFSVTGQQIPTPTGLAPGPITFPG